MAYPSWDYYPRNVRPPEWATNFIAVVRAAELTVSTEKKATGLNSDAVLAALAEGLGQLGYAVETGKTKAGRISKPVLFGQNGTPEVSYEIDAFHEQLGVAVEVEAGRGARGNATYRDLIRTSLILDACYLALLLPLAYRHQSGGREVAVKAYDEIRHQLNAIYASQRLRLPFDGILLIGY